MSWNRPYVVALRLHREGNLHDALIGTSALICSYKGVARLHHLRGKIYFDLKKYELALDDLNEAVRLEKMKPEYYGSRGVLHLEMNNLVEAERDLRYSNYLSHDRLRFDYSLGNVYFKLKDYCQAAHHYRRALNRGRGKYVHKKLGVCYAYMNNYELASKHFKIAENVYPNDFIIQYYLGRCEFEFGKKVVNKSLFEVLNGINHYECNKDANAYFNNALLSLNKTKTLHSNDTLAFFFCAQIYIYQNNLTMAEIEISQAIRTDPTNEILYHVWEKVNNLLKEE